MKVENQGHCLLVKILCSDF